jgi:diguanylate cyclase (GGDEF)-like protein
MTPLRAPLARLDRSRDELAKAWLVRLIERASLDEIRELPTEQIARELPELITDVVRLASAAAGGGDPYDLTESQAGRVAAFAGLRASRREGAATEVARDVAALQAVLVAALRQELADRDPDAFADAVERLVDATGALQAAAAEALLRSRARELESQANTDPLTGLGNLRALQRELGRLVELYRRYRHPFALLLLDIDGLRRINDSHGHQAGDRVLMRVAMSVRRAIRSVDLAARLGGDEFCVLAPVQDAQGAGVIAERLAAAVSGEVSAPGEPPVGVSVGVAACPEHGEEAEGLVETADRAMYVAKAAGELVALGSVHGGPFAEHAKP